MNTKQWVTLTVGGLGIAWANLGPWSKPVPPIVTARPMPDGSTQMTLTVPLVSTPVLVTGIVLIVVAVLIYFLRSKHA